MGFGTFGRVMDPFCRFVKNIFKRGSANACVKSFQMFLVSMDAG